MIAGVVLAPFALLEERFNCSIPRTSSLWRYPQHVFSFSTWLIIC